MKTVRLQSVSAISVANVIAGIKLIEVLAWQLIQPLYFGFLAGKYFDDTTFGTKFALGIYQCVLPVLVSWVAACLGVTMYNVYASRRHRGITIRINQINELLSQEPHPSAINK